MAIFPNEYELKKIRKKMAKVRGTQGLLPHASPIDRAKYEVCEQLLIYMKKKRMNQRELAEALQTSETRISEIVHFRIQKFTLDRLVTFLQMVQPMMTLRVA